MEGKFGLNPIHFVRGLQSLLAILTLGLFAHVSQFFNTHTSTPGTVAFAVFTSVFTLLVILPYVLLTPRFFPSLFKSHTKYTILTLEFLAMLFWFVSFVATASFLTHLPVCIGPVCGAAKAGVAFAAISWVTWGITSLFALRFCLGVGVGAPEKIGKGERKRERLARALRVHRVWAGQGVGNLDGDGSRSERKLSIGMPQPHPQQQFYNAGSGDSGVAWPGGMHGTPMDVRPVDARWDDRAVHPPPRPEPSVGVGMAYV